MKRIILVGLATALVAAVSFFSALPKAVKSEELSQKAFTVAIVENQFDLQGREVYSEYVLGAVRSDGSEVRVSRRKLPDGQWFQPKWVLDLSLRKRVSVEPATGSILTYPLSDKAVAEYRAPRASCGKISLAEPSQLLGQRVVHMREDAAPDSYVDRWLAPALNCFPLRETFTFTSGPPTATRRIVRQALFLIPGEPARSLFQIPASYVERSPSEMAAEFARRFPGHDAMSTKSAQRLDDIYRTARQRAR